MKLRYWYKTDHNKQPIPGSNLRRKSRPGASHQWREILDPCCNPEDISCTCGPRYFIQLDGRGKPVDGTLIKRQDQPRNNYPEGTVGNKLYEIRWKSPCCVVTLDYSFVTNDSPGFLRIYQDGNLIKEIVGDESGQLKVSQDAVITIIVTNNNTSNNFVDLSITGATTFSGHDQSTVTNVFSLTENSVVTAELTDN
jgi:hypothetical protein